MRVIAYLFDVDTILFIIQIDFFDAQSQVFIIEEYIAFKVIFEASEVNVCASTRTEIIITDQEF